MTRSDVGPAPKVFSRIIDTWRPEPTTTEGATPLWPAAALASLLGAPELEDGDELPLMWHEVYLRPTRVPADLGADGHPTHDVLVPDLRNRRRMFGGGRLCVHGPIRIGDRLQRESGVTSIRTREGRSGVLLLVTEKHELSVGGEVRVVDERDIVYRLASDVTVTAALPTAPDATTRPVADSTLEPDERLLFMFSALTYNAHRIHYDRTYTTEVEGHPSLIVHGPLLAIHALGVARERTGIEPSAVDYRLLAPAYCGSRVDFSVTVHSGKPATVAAFQDGRQCLAMEVTR